MKKTILLGILFVAILLTGYLLSAIPPVKPLKLADLSEVEGIIRTVLTRHAISEDQIRTRTIAFDNGATRVVHTVPVPAAWPKTRYHLDLNDTLRQVGLDTFGVVEFPDRHLRIHIMHRGKVIRTVALNTDRTIY